MSIRGRALGLLAALAMALMLLGVSTPANAHTATGPGELSDTGSSRDRHLFRVDYDAMDSEVTSHIPPGVIAWAGHLDPLKESTSGPACRRVIPACE